MASVSRSAADSNVDGSDKRGTSEAATDEQEEGGSKDEAVRLGEEKEGGYEGSVGPFMHLSLRRSSRAHTSPDAAAAAASSAARSGLRTENAATAAAAAATASPGALGAARARSLSLLSLPPVVVVRAPWCSKGHRMDIAYGTEPSPPGYPRFDCNGCEVKNCADPRWCCGRCQEDLCFGCQAEPTSVDASASSFSSPAASASSASSSTASSSSTSASGALAAPPPWFRSFLAAAAALPARPELVDDAARAAADAAVSGSRGARSKGRLLSGLFSGGGHGSFGGGGDGDSEDEADWGGPFGSFAFARSLWLVRESHHDLIDLSSGDPAAAAAAAAVDAPFLGAEAEAGVTAAAAVVSDGVPGLRRITASSCLDAALFGASSLRATGGNPWISEKLSPGPASPSGLATVEVDLGFPFEVSVLLLRAVPNAAAMGWAGCEPRAVTLHAWLCNDNDDDDDVDDDVGGGSGGSGSNGSGGNGGEGWKLVKAFPDLPAFDPAKGNAATLSGFLAVAARWRLTVASVRGGDHVALQTLELYGAPEPTLDDGRAAAFLGTSCVSSIPAPAPAVAAAADGDGDEPDASVAAAAPAPAASAASTTADGVAAAPSPSPAPAHQCDNEGGILVGPLRLPSALADRWRAVSGDAGVTVECWLNPVDAAAPTTAPAPGAAVDGASEGGGGGGGSSGDYWGSVFVLEVPSPSPAAAPQLRLALSRRHGSGELKLTLTRTLDRGGGACAAAGSTAGAALAEALVPQSAALAPHRFSHVALLASRAGVQVVVDGGQSGGGAGGGGVEASCSLPLGSFFDALLAAAAPAAPAAEAAAAAGAAGAEADPPPPGGATAVPGLSMRLCGGTFVGFAKELRVWWGCRSAPDLRAALRHRGGSPGRLALEGSPQLVAFRRAIGIDLPVPAAATAATSGQVSGQPRAPLLAACLSLDGPPTATVMAQASPGNIGGASSSDGGLVTVGRNVGWAVPGCRSSLWACAAGGTCGFGAGGTVGIPVVRRAATSTLRCLVRPHTFTASSARLAEVFGSDRSGFRRFRAELVFGSGGGEGGGGGRGGILPIDEQVRASVHPSSQCPAMPLWFASLGYLQTCNLRKMCTRQLTFSLCFSCHVHTLVPKVVEMVNALTANDAKVDPQLLHFGGAFAHATSGSGGGAAAVISSKVVAGYPLLRSAPLATLALRLAAIQRLNSLVSVARAHSCSRARSFRASFFFSSPPPHPFFRGALIRSPRGGSATHTRIERCDSRSPLPFMRTAATATTTTTPTTNNTDPQANHRKSFKAPS